MAVVLHGSALRPTPLIMPMDYTAARAQAWLAALDKAIALLPPSANRRLGDIGLGRDDTGGNAALRALAAELFPVDVATPQISSGQEIKVYLRQPENFTNFSRIASDADAIALKAMIILEMEEEISALGKTWPKTLDEAREKTAELESRASALEALWHIQSLNIRDHETGASLKTWQALARAAPQSPVARLMLAEALLRDNKPQQCIAEATSALDLGRNFDGEMNVVWKILKPRARYARAIAQWRVNQLALAEDDLNTAILEAKYLPPRNRIRLFDVRGVLKLQKGDLEGMCEDFASACALGNCQNLARARRMGQCAQ